MSRASAAARRSCRPGVLAAGGLVVLALLAPGTAVAGAVPEPGSDGMGDAYFPLDGNGGIDVVEYEIHDDYRFRDGRLRGWTRLTVRATQDLSSFHLDLLLPTRRVRVDGAEAAYTRPNEHELRIVPPATIGDGDTFHVRVDYAGHPGQVAWKGESNWLADRHEVVAMNQPHMAAWWFPANDHPRDTALMDVHVTVPKDKEVVSNGHLVGRTVRDGRATVRWRAREPMAPYLAFFAAGEFDVASGTSDGLPWYAAVSRRLTAAQRETSMDMVKRSAEIVRWLEGELGVGYPFSTTGGVVTSLHPGFALENQTRPTYEALGNGDTWLLVHELAHQWFGDSVGVENWDDIWLNEGPATFFEVRYDATHGGQSAGAWLDRWYASGADSHLWDVTIADPGADNIFDWPVYVRGGMTLQALRQRIGDDMFWEVLGTWVDERRGGNGSTEQFIALAEQVSGEDLTGFFQAWVYADEKPADTVANGLG